MSMNSTIMPMTRTTINASVAQRLGLSDQKIAGRGGRPHPYSRQIPAAAGSASQLQAPTSIAVNPGYQPFRHVGGSRRTPSQQTCATAASTMDTGKTDALSTWPCIKPVLQGQRVRNEAVIDKYLSKNWSGIPENIELENMLMKTEISSEKVENRIKKSLFRNLKFWEKICTYDSVLNIIKNGYSLPFMSQPPTMHLRNNKSALNNESFVS